MAENVTPADLGPETEPEEGVVLAPTDEMIAQHMEMMYSHKHYIRVNENNKIISYWSNGPDSRREPIEGKDILLRENGGYQFRMFDGQDDKTNPENPSIMSFEGIYFYTYENGMAVKASREEIDAETEAMRAARLAANEEAQAAQ